ncbi:U3 small nucleolar RNA-associated protein 6, putative [Plasmodium sp. gorilla clade G2]|uniref:U3 small nucleolar RNA-associated protein 6, putative n=1 Tax=Plasmodium sp. gorilla clade G2 TaxID=880535 RepID=UPI000D2074B6|nr:U3 small nucleolar RNA-associated protein 6, putative [Plasmodium sp. gorilla clade G2]SOV17397.1 U3 small nucleolar RNA-associated protein 6, putative [Plasmodium sp. gorilla clade G2]
MDKVCKIIENMIYEFNDLKRKELFSDKEIIAIANKRRHHEYRINSPTSVLLHFILYLEFEMNLENLRTKRKNEKKEKLIEEILQNKNLIKDHYKEFSILKNKMEEEKNFDKFKELRKLLNKNENESKKFKNNVLKVEKKLQTLLGYSLSEYSLIKRIINIFDVCLRKNYNNISLWLQYFNFCFIKKKYDELENAILNSLKYHIKNELIWLIYLFYFYNIKKNIIQTRMLYLRAILFIPDSIYLNVLYFHFEFDVFMKLINNYKKKIETDIHQIKTNETNNNNHINGTKKKNKNDEQKIQNIHGYYENENNNIKVNEQKNKKDNNNMNETICINSTNDTLDIRTTTNISNNNNNNYYHSGASRGNINHNINNSNNNKYLNDSNNVIHLKDLQIDHVYGEFLKTNMDNMNIINSNHISDFKVNADDNNGENYLTSFDNNIYSVIKEEDKYGLDVIIFLIKKYMSTLGSDKSKLHIFVFLLLNTLLKIEKNSWIKMYTRQYDDFKQVVLDSINSCKFEEPFLYYYFFIETCVNSCYFDFFEDTEFTILKDEYYKRSMEKLENKNIYKIEKYFKYEHVKNLLKQLFNMFDNELMIYFFCIILTNLYDNISVYNNISEIFTIDINVKNDILEKQHENKEINNTYNTNNTNNNDNLENNILDNTDTITNNPTVNNINTTKNILHYMKEPNLTCHEDLEIFHFLKDDIFLCSNYKFHKLNMDFIKENNINTYDLLCKLNFITHVCLMEKNHSQISSNNYLFSYDKTNKNKDILSSILYFFLFNPKNMVQKLSYQKGKNNDIKEEKMSPNFILKKRKQTKDFLSSPSISKKIKRENQNKAKKKFEVNIYENDSDNKSVSDTDEATDDESDDESDEKNDKNIQDNNDNSTNTSDEEEKTNIYLKKSKNTQLIKKKEIHEKEFFIIDKLLLILTKKIHVLVKIHIIKCILTIVVYLDNENIKACLSMTIKQEYKNIMKINVSGKYSNELNEMINIYKKVYLE